MQTDDHDGRTGLQGGRKTDARRAAENQGMFVLQLLFGVEDFGRRKALAHNAISNSSTLLSVLLRR